MISFKTKKKKIRKTFKEFRHFFQSVDFIQGVTSKHVTGKIIVYCSIYGYNEQHFSFL